MTSKTTVAAVAETGLVEPSKKFYIVHGANRCLVQMKQSDVNDITANGWMEKEPYGGAKGYQMYKVISIGTFKNLWRLFGVVA
jgi:hypothetical protein